MNREEFIAIASAINLAGSHHENEVQRNARVQGAIVMATSLADALGMAPPRVERGAIQEVKVEATIERPSPRTDGPYEPTTLVEPVPPPVPARPSARPEEPSKKAGGR